MPTGTFSQKIHVQSSPSATAPPTTGPTATPSPLMPLQMPTAALRMRSGTAAASSVSDSGITAAPAAPCTARAVISIHGSVASAHAADATVNSPMPNRNSRRRPSRSPRADAVSSSAAKDSV